MRLPYTAPTLRKLSPIEAIEARIEMRNADIQDWLAEGERPFVCDAPKNNWGLLVSRDPSKPTQWRVTRFECETPVGHTECATYEAAVREVYALGGCLPGRKVG